MVIAISLAVIVVVGTFLFVRGRVRSERSRAVTELVEAAEVDSRDGHWDRALNRLDAAMGLVEGDRADALRARRQEVSDSARRLRHKRAIEQATADLDAARRALQSDPSGALSRVVRAHEAASRTPDPRADQLADEARKLAAGLAESRGVQIVPPPGPFLFGEEAGALLAADLEKLAAPTLSARGYLPPPVGSPLATLWDCSAPFRFSIEVVETFGEGYLQSNAPNRTAQLEGVVALTRADRSSEVGPIWQVRVVGRTRSPVPEMSAFASSRIGVGTRREPHVERLLYNDARGQFLGKLVPLLTGLPAWERAAR